MKNITIRQILEATGGKLLCGPADLPVENICIDSRKAAGNDIFVPMTGERTDGHRFIEKAFENGCTATFTSEHDAREDTRPWIRVEDTVKALQDLGFYLRGRLHMPFVGITGSVGKTSTRNMVTAALAASLRVTSTEGNSNGQLGVPVTLGRMDEDAEIAVLEMGMSLPGEMARIARIARPDLAVFTNIGVSHIENLGSQEAILREKMHIADGFGPENTLILNEDDPLLRGAEGPGGCRVLRYGTAKTADCRAEDLRETDSGSRFTFCSPAGKLPVELSVPGRHNVSNALAALTVTMAVGADLPAAAEALAAYGGAPRRLQRIRLSGFTVIDDSYNASPDSMRAALEVLKGSSGGRRIAVLADMLELGERAPEFHREVGGFAAGRADLVAAIGPLSVHLADGAEAAGVPVLRFSGNDEASRYLRGALQPGDTVLLKGSNGMHLEEVLSALRDVSL